MVNGSLIEGLFAVVKKAEKSARPALPEEIQSRGPNPDPAIDFEHRCEDCGDDRGEANSEAE